MKFTIQHQIHLLRLRKQIFETTRRLMQEESSIIPDLNIRIQVKMQVIMISTEISALESQIDYLENLEYVKL